MASSAVTSQPRAAMQYSLLPEANSLDLELVLVTPEETIECVLINKGTWSGPLSDEAYLRREEFLANQEATINGGLTRWILIDRKDTGSPRNVLAACESHRKRAFVARRGGEAKEVLAFGIGSVYCREEHRGKGYAVRMMLELRKKLHDWQQQAGLKTNFTVLYSDIGKKFYAKNGWLPYPSSHISLKPDASAKTQYPQSRPLETKDLPELCRRDETLLKGVVANFAASSPSIRVALIPTSQAMNWHHAREDFLTKELLGRTPVIRGAIVEHAPHGAVWCIWTRLFQKDPEENSLQILRIVVEDEGSASSQASSSENVQSVAACLAAAQEEAAAWDSRVIELWNPTPTVQAAAQLLDPGAQIIHRENHSIACLNWYGNEMGTEHVEWVANEKYGWV